MSKQLRLPTILVIADNPTIRFWIKKNLDDQYFIITAETQQEAIKALNSRLDFIILDSEFEDCNALDLCKEIHSLTLKSIVPILLITGRLKKSFRDQAMKCGVTEFLSDQLDLHELFERIEMGKKNAATRQKTEDLDLSVKLPKFTSKSSLKHKLILNEQALKLLASAKEKNLPVSFLLIQVDGEGEPQVLFEFLHSMTREQDALFLTPDQRLILLLFNAGSDAAKRVAETLKERIRREKKMSASIAVSSLEASEQSFYKMLEVAAKSLKSQENS